MIKGASSMYLSILFPNMDRDLTFADWIANHSGDRYYDYVDNLAYATAIRALIHGDSDD